MAATQTQSTPISLTPQRQPVSNRARFWIAFRRNRVALVGLAIVILLGLGAVFAPYIAPYDPIEPHYTARLAPPGGEFLLGTDELGRDLFSRLLYGARISLVIGFIAQGVALVIGMTLGMVAGWYGGWIDDLIMRTTDVFFAIPGLMFLIVWVTIFEPGPISIFLALGLIGWPGEARMMRSQVLGIKELDYVLAARALGAPAWRIMAQHILPNALAPMIVLATLGIAGVILSEATLSFLGLGIQIPTPSWGTMVQFGKNYLPTGQWWYAVIPGLTIMITVLGFNFLGDGLRDALDPTLYE
ncbi:MAG: ABC transporter permease [Chloroflexi bacterium]|nr:ABC transporter permease [Chloroflexota bacterium]